MAGKFICLDGFEGAGKTTRAQALATKLEGDYQLQCHLVREPGGDDFAEKIRTILKHGGCEITLMAEVFAFNAARTNMLELQVAPRLAEGVYVIGDRTYMSTLTYQGYGNGLEGGQLEQLRQLCKLASQAASPDQIIVLDVALETAMSRIAMRGGQTDRFESRSAEYLDKVRYGYAAEAAVGSYALVDANQPEDVVDREILKHVLKILD